MTQDSASTTLDLPEPLGPTTAVTPGSNSKVVAEAKDLNPRTVRVFRCTGVRSPEVGVAGRVSPPLYSSAATTPLPPAGRRAPEGAPARPERARAETRSGDEERRR